MKTIPTHGYDRRSKVPAISGTVPKLCTECQSWFAAFGKERRCDSCVPATESRRRAARRHYAELAEQEPENGSQGRTGHRGRKRPGTPRGRRFSTNDQLNGIVSDGGQLCRELARELAGKIDFPKGAPVPMSRALKIAYTRRNVEAGLQGRCDLERLTS